MFSDCLMENSLIVHWACVPKERIYRSHIDNLESRILAQFVSHIPMFFQVVPYLCVVRQTVLK